jgi:hypothetical protein
VRFGLQITNAAMRRQTMKDEMRSTADDERVICLSVAIHCTTREWPRPCDRQWRISVRTEH